MRHPLGEHPPGSHLRPWASLRLCRDRCPVWAVRPLPREAEVKCTVEDLRVMAANRWAAAWVRFR